MMKVLQKNKYRVLIVAVIAICSVMSCIQPPLHLPGQELVMRMPRVETELSVVWDCDVNLDEDWYYGWDRTDDSIWGHIGYTEPLSYEVHRYFKGDNPNARHTDVDAFNIRSNRFRRYFQFGYYDMLFYSDIETNDGTQVVVMHETLDSIIATTTGTRGISTRIKFRSGAEEIDTTQAIGLLNQPEIFFGGYPENIYISPDLDDYEYDPQENVYIKHIDAQLRPLVYIYLVQFVLYNNEDGKIQGVNGNAALSSMASSTNVNTGHTGNQPAVVYFNTRMKKDLTVKGRKSDVIGGKLTTFGLCDNEPYTRAGALYSGRRTTLNNYLYFDLVWKNGGVMTYDFDVTDQCRSQAHGGILTVWIDCNKLTPPEPGPASTGSLFLPTVEDYKEVFWEIDI